VSVFIVSAADAVATYVSLVDAARRADGWGVRAPAPPNDGDGDGSGGGGAADVLSSFCSAAYTRTVKKSGNVCVCIAVKQTVDVQW
jgi:hypothetical protein